MLVKNEEILFRVVSIPQLKLCGVCPVCLSLPSKGVLIFGVCVSESVRALCVCVADAVYHKLFGAFGVQFSL